MVAPGIHYGLGMEEYHAWKLDKAKLKEGPISCSMLKAFDPNPYAWLRSPEFVPTSAMKTGSLFDLALTDPDELESQTALMEFDSFKTKAAREWRDSLGGKLVVTEKELAHAKKAAAAVRDHAVAGLIMHRAQCQVGVVGSIKGIPAKCLLDILPHEDSDHAETIYDYKTTSKGLGDEAIRKQIGDLKYHWQAAFYQTLFNKVSTDRHIENFGFIFQDVKTLESRVVTLSEEALALGRLEVKAAVDDFYKCAQRGIHSRYRKSTDELDLMPFHAMAGYEQLEKRE